MSLTDPYQTFLRPSSTVESGPPGEHSHDPGRALFPVAAVESAELRGQKISPRPVPKDAPRAIIHTRGAVSSGDGSRVLSRDRPSGLEPFRQKQHDAIMQRPDVKNFGPGLIRTGTKHSQDGVEMDGSEPVVEQVPQPRAWVAEGDDGCAASCEICGDLDGFDDVERTLEENANECFEHISRARARYHEGDPECEADYRAAFLVDARLTATEIVRELKNELRDDVGYVLISCMERLAIDSRDVVARARLGLTLLLLYQDSEAFKNLQRAFLQHPSWRPLLRVLVNKVKMRRAAILPLIVRFHQDARP